ncbi:MAG: hypothetical protein M3364_06290 [Actinomycetota bacterium]|nr:hypothetical protein [Actinomycetota bacterium]
MSLRVALLTFGALGLLCAGTSLASNPKGEGVFVNAIVEQVGPIPPGSPGPSPIGWATVHVKVTAEDVDPSVPSCSSCPTADTGWIEITEVYPDDPRPALVISAPVNWVHINLDGSATVQAGMCGYTFVDGGAPGNEAVGPAGPGGLVPTRDSMSIGCFAGLRGRVNGSLIGGNIRID